MLPHVLLLSLSTTVACNRSSSPNEPVTRTHSPTEETSDNEGGSEVGRVMFECIPEVGAPYAKIRILTYDPYADDKSPDLAADEMPKAMDLESENDHESTVLFELNDGAQSMIGTCKVIPRTPVECHNGELRMQWSGNPSSSGDETVTIIESWLFTNKEFTAQCMRKF